MSLPRTEVDIARNLKAIEWLKAELVGSAAEVLRGMARSNDEQVEEGLANLVMATFLLGRRLGVGYGRLHQKVVQKARANVERRHELEQWYGDFSSLLEYWGDQAR